MVKNKMRSVDFLLDNKGLGNCTDPISRHFVVDNPSSLPSVGFTRSGICIM